MGVTITNRRNDFDFGALKVTNPHCFSFVFLERKKEDHHQKPISWVAKLKGEKIQNANWATILKIRCIRWIQESKCVLKSPFLKPLRRTPSKNPSHTLFPFKTHRKTREPSTPLRRRVVARPPWRAPYRDTFVGGALEQLLGALK